MRWTLTFFMFFANLIAGDLAVTPPARVQDAQGLVSVYSKAGLGWQFCRQGESIQIGDRIKTALRGPHAASLKIDDATEVILGPGSLVELTDKNVLWLQSGYLSVEQQGSLKIMGPKKNLLNLSSGNILECRGNEVVFLERSPSWLKGFKGTSVRESLGELITKVDGREVALSMGYLKITVDIRDQIARTRIEQSFINHTHGRLEGVFQFPLPRDASVSGFGMWIGNELVEADIVERRKAREIYETILRERRDPGLLEWEGAGMFKARVFPIEAMSEKRITISYTQTLPMADGQYTYFYPMRSELLRRTPLRELDLSIHLFSSQKIKATQSNYAIQNNPVAEGSVLRFHADEFAPTEDFRLQIQTEKNEVPQLLTHRRGEDGTMMLMLDLPKAIKEQLKSQPHQKNKEVLFLVDTSAATYPEDRQRQLNAIQALLSLLDKNDTFNLGCVDVDVQWIFKGSVNLDSAAIDKALSFLENRASLGWTDLPKMAQQILPHLKPNTHVIYLGDGRSTAPPYDPAKIAQHIQATLAGAQGTFHVIRISEQYEAETLKALSRGGCSLSATDLESSQRAAQEWSLSLERPTLHHLKVSFTGLPVACIWPEEIPRVVDGQQLIITGRYLPNDTNQLTAHFEGDDGHGNILRCQQDFQLSQEDGGNSFLPRLWARGRLEKLLSQADTSDLREEIIDLSERFQIMTPFTSFLVLETEADRERFGVKRQLRLRDGERYFSESHEKLNLALKESQMQKAQLWRNRLVEQARASLLQQLEFPVSRPEYSDGRIRIGKGFSAGGYIGRVSRNSTFTVRTPTAVAGVRGSSMPTSFSDTMPIDAMKESSDSSNEIGGEIAFESMSEMEELSAPLEPKVESVQNELKGDRQQLEKKSKMNYGSRDRRAPASRVSVVNWDSDSSLFSGLTLTNHSSPTLSGPISQLFPTPNPTQQHIDPTLWPESLRQWYDQLQLNPSQLQQIQTQHLSFDHTGKVTSTRNKTITWQSGNVVRYQTKSNIPEQLEWLCDLEAGQLTYPFGFGGRQALETPPQGGLIAPYFEGLNLQQYQYLTPVEGHVHRYKNRYQQEFKFNIQGHQLLSVQAFYHDKLQWEQKLIYDGQQDLPRRIEFRNASGELQWSEDITILSVAPELTLKTQLQTYLKSSEPTLFIKTPQPSWATAFQHFTDKSASLEELIVLMDAALNQQRYDRTERILPALLEKITTHDHRLVIELQARSNSRQYHKAEQLLFQAAKEWSLDSLKSTSSAHWLWWLNKMTQGQNFSAQERLDLLNQYQSRFNIKNQDLEVQRAWENQRLNVLQQTGRHEQTQQYAQELLLRYPGHHEYLQAIYNSLQSQQSYNEAMTLLDQQFSTGAYSIDQQRNLWNQFFYSNSNHVKFHELKRSILKRLEDLDPDGVVTPNLKIQFLSQDLSYEAFILELENILNSDINLENNFHLAEINAVLQCVMGYRYYNGINHQSTYIDILPSIVNILSRLPLNAKGVQLSQSILNHQQFWTFPEAKITIQDLIRKVHEQLITLDTNLLNGLFNTTAFKHLVEKKQWLDWANMLEHQQNEMPNDSSDSYIYDPTIQLIETVYNHAQDPLGFLTYLERWIQHVETSQRPQLQWRWINTSLNAPWTEPLEEQQLRMWNQMDWSLTSFQGASTLHRLGTFGINGWLHAQLQSIDQSQMDRITVKQLNEDQLKASQKRWAQILKGFRILCQSEMRPWVQLEENLLQVQQDGPDQQVESIIKTLLADLKELEVHREDDASFNKELAMRKINILCWIIGTHKYENSYSSETLALLKKWEQHESLKTHAQMLIHQLLLCEASSEPLIQQLESWITKSSTPWEYSFELAQIYAEKGQLEKAIQICQTHIEYQLFDAEPLATYADWHLALGQREKYQALQKEKYNLMDEYALSQKLSQFSNTTSRNRRTSSPAEIHPELFAILPALMQKAQRPQNYLWNISNIYQSTRDFRILKSMANSLLGQGRGNAYQMLQHLNQNILAHGFEEASFDEVLKGIQECLAQTQDATEQRTLHLFQANLWRQLARTQNQASEPGDRCIQELKTCLKLDWFPGERKLMLQHLCSWGVIHYQPLAEAQLKSIKMLLQQERHTDDHLEMSLSHAQLLRNYGGTHTSKALQLCQNVLQSTLKNQPDQDPWPSTCYNIYKEQLECLLDLKQVQEGRRLLTEQQLSSDHQSHRTKIDEMFLWFDTQIFSRGKNQPKVELEHIFVQRHQNIMETLQREPRLLTQDHLQFYQNATHQIKEMVQINLNVITDQVGEAMLYQREQYGHWTHAWARWMKTVSGENSAMVWLINMLEKEPQLSQHQVYQSLWYRSQYDMAQWRKNAHLSQAWSDRFQQCLENMLRKELTQPQRNHYGSIFVKNNNNFWKELESKFEIIALNVIETHPDHPEIIAKAAIYLGQYLRHYQQGAEALNQLQQERKLPKASYAAFIDFNQKIKAHETIITACPSFIKNDPLQIQWRTALLRAYFKTNRLEEAKIFLTHSENELKKLNLWNGQSLVQMGSVCMEEQHFALALPWIESGLTLLQRLPQSQSNELVDAYQKLSQVQVKLGNVDQAIKEACGAIVVWNRDQNHRMQGLENLCNILRQLPDLESWAHRFSTQMEEQQTEQPIVRKALAKVFEQQHKPQLATEHLTALLHQQPNDDQARNQLLQILRHQQQWELAQQVQYEGTRYERTNPSLYTSLLSLAKKTSSEELWRCVSSTIEVAPRDDVAYRLLADYCQNNDQWHLAAQCWDKARDLRGEDPELWLNAAWAWSKAGEVSKGLEISHAIKGQKWDPRFHGVIQKCDALIEKLKGQL